MNQAQKNLVGFCRQKRNPCRNKLISEQYLADKAKASENEIKSKVMKLEEDFTEENERTYDIM